MHAGGTKGKLGRLNPTNKDHMLQIGSFDVRNLLAILSIYTMVTKVFICLDGRDKSHLWAEAVRVG